MRSYVRAANITWSGWDFSDVKKMNFDEHDFVRFRLMPGDVLVNEGSGSAKEVGKPAIWRGQIENCCFQNTLIRVQPNDCTSEYIYFYFLYNAVTERFVSKTQGVNIYHIGKEGLAEFPIPVAPFLEQTEIVHRIETAFAWLDRVAAEHTNASRLLPKLDQAIRGELLPQDPNDKPLELSATPVAEGYDRRGR
jgi:type I restriction enzyme S subunit